MNSPPIQPVPRPVLISSPTTASPSSTQKPLDIQAEFSAVRETYNSQPTKNFAAVIEYGESGGGKTTLLRTCPGPVLLYMFDPGGEKVLRSSKDPKHMTIENGGILVVNLSQLDVKDPKTWVALEQKHQEFKRKGLYQHLGTVAIDSLTTASAALMATILKRNGREGGTPQIQDYMVHMSTLKDFMRDLIDQPCHTIFLAHVDTEKDEPTGRVLAGPYIIGKQAKIDIPLLVDELWVAQTKQGAISTTYSILTQNDGLWKARTRMGFDGIFTKNEDPDFKALLKKAGYSNEDKPLFNSKPKGSIS